MEIKNSAVRQIEERCDIDDIDDCTIHREIVGRREGFPHGEAKVAHIFITNGEGAVLRQKVYRYCEEEPWKGAGHTVGVQTRDSMPAPVHGAAGDGPGEGAEVVEIERWHTQTSRAVRTG